MTCLIALMLVAAGFATVCGVVYIASVTEQPREQNKWERMTGRPCLPPDRTGLPTSPPPPRRRQ
jgi:hypothetical protein